MTETAWAVAITAVIGPLITLAVQESIKWINNRQTNQRQIRADSLAELWTLVESYKQQVVDVKKEWKVDVEELRDLLQHCQEDHLHEAQAHQYETQARQRAETWMKALEGSLRKAHIDFEPYDFDFQYRPIDTGSRDHKALPPSPPQEDDNGI
jgi:phenylalanyl-tRNA synthetase alpha subunit